jgi:hypothetical protein
MRRGKIISSNANEGKGVEEEESKDDDDCAENAPPELPVHGGLDVLFSLNEILHRKVERVEGPNVEGRQCS